MAMVEEAKPKPAMGENVEKKVKEGHYLLGSPTFKELENGRFKCIETGHELPAKDMESYGQSKRCRLGLIDSALSLQKPPLNMFKQDPLCRSKLKCKLTGDTVNKSEEHIWKHINGRRFLHKLEQKEEEKLASGGTEPVESKNKKPSQKVSKPKTKSVGTDLENNVGLDESQPRRPSDVEDDSEEIDFWIPPVGSRWDNDDGGDRWGSDSELESEEGIEVDGVEGSGTEAGELSQRAKRMSIEVGPSSFASRKKKSKTSS